MKVKEISFHFPFKRPNSIDLFWNHLKLVLTIDTHSKSLNHGLMAIQTDSQIQLCFWIWRKVSVFRISYEKLNFD